MDAFRQSAEEKENEEGKKGEAEEKEDVVKERHVQEEE